MNRNLRFVVLLMVLLTSLSFSQDQDEEPLPPPKRAGSTKIGGAGGFLQEWTFMDFGSINELMRKENLGEFSNNSMFTLGGQGYAYIMVIPNFRVGGMGMSGSSTVNTKSGNAVRQVKLSLGYGGVTFDYVFNVLPRLDITGGMLFGGGGIDFDISRNYGVIQDWPTLWDEFGSNNAADQYSSKLSGSFYIYQPSLNIEYSILRWVGLRVGVSYLGMSNPTWTRDDQFDVYDVPSGVSGKGWSFNTGIFVGTFVF